MMIMLILFTDGRTQSECRWTKLREQISRGWTRTWRCCRRPWSSWTTPPTWSASGTWVTATGPWRPPVGASTPSTASTPTPWVTSTTRARARTGTTSATTTRWCGPPGGSTLRSCTRRVRSASSGNSGGAGSPSSCTTPCRPRMRRTKPNRNTSTGAVTWLTGSAGSTAGWYWPWMKVSVTSRTLWKLRWASFGTSEVLPRPLFFNWSRNKSEDLISLFFQYLKIRS